MLQVVRTKIPLLGPQGHQQPRAGIARGGLDQKGSVCPTEVVPSSHFIENEACIVWAW